MTSARSKSQTSRSAAVRIGQLAIGYWLAKSLGKRGTMKRFEQLITARMKGKENESD
jgi:hypothetical protein